MYPNKSKFFTMFLSLVPGVGHMYLGYMKRGCSFLVMFCVTIALATFVSALCFVLPIIWFYSFFDAYNLRNKYIITDQINDEFIFEIDSLKKIFGGSSSKYIGIGLIVLGFLGLWESTIKYVLSDLLESININASIIYNFPTLVICMALIAMGIKLIIGAKSKQ